MTILIGTEVTTEFGTGHPTIIASMLINTLKNEELAREIISGKMDTVKKLAEEQRVHGTGFLHIMIAHPEIDEEKLLPSVCKAAEDASGLPLYIDSSDIVAIKRTLDVIDSKPILSVNGEELKMKKMLPLVKDGNTAVICLCFDEDGISPNAETRISVAEKIVQRARSIGIADDDLVIDPLAMSVGVCDYDSMMVSFEGLRLVKERLNLSTFLGVDNVGFGLPFKDYIDFAFLLAAIPTGLDSALLEPMIATEIGIRGIVQLNAVNFMSGRDPYAKEYSRYLRKNNLTKKTSLL
jgi:5-methyltetrahydrofolate--homocysteine methyltransferase